MNLNFFGQQHVYSKTIQFYCLNIMDVYFLISLVHKLCQFQLLKIALQMLAKILLSIKIQILLWEIFRTLYRPANSKAQTIQFTSILHGQFLHGWYFYHLLISFYNFNLFTARPNTTLHGDINFKLKHNEINFYRESSSQ